MNGSHRSIRLWDWPLRLFHWLLVIAIALAFLSSEEDSVLNQWHVLSGWVASILIAFRLAWGFVGGEHSRFSDFVRPSLIADHVSSLFRGRRNAVFGHNPLGAVSVLILLALVAATVSTGALGASDGLHEVIAWTLLAMVGLHVAAVIAMSLLERENLVRAMVTGKRPAIRHPRSTDARPPRLGGFVVAILVVIGVAYAIVQYDPQAFTLRSAESFEHRAGVGGDHSSRPEHSDRDD